MRIRTASEISADLRSAEDQRQQRLAYGLSHFDAATWMQSAHAIAMALRLVEDADGGEGLYVGLPAEPVDPQSLKQHNLLLSILGFSRAMEDRGRLVVEEIRRAWPQLICREPSA